MTSRRTRIVVLVAVLTVGGAASPFSVAPWSGPASARAGEIVPLEGQACGDPGVNQTALVADHSRSRSVQASDALYVLQTAVGTKSCATCICDVNRSRTITAGDALIVLKFAVGQPLTLSCFACVPPPTDPSASYAAEKGGNDTAGANDAALENGAGYGPGVLGLGFVFDGVDDQVMIPHEEDQNPGKSFTVSAWINADTYGHGRPIAQKRTAANVGGFTFEAAHPPFGPNLSLSFVLWFDGATVTALTPPDLVTLGAWHHAAATYDGDKIKIFVDGAERTSVSETRATDASTEPVVLGRNVVFPSNVWDGSIDELRFFPRALTSFEVNSLYVQGHDFDALSGLAAVRLYRAEGNANDSASGPDASLTNGAGFGPGRIGTALQLDGIDDFVEAPAATLGSATDVTVTAWIRTTDGDGTVYSLSHDTVQDELLVGVYAGKVSVFNHKAIANYTRRSSDSFVNTGEWVFVAGVISGGGDTSNLKVYVDGVEETGTSVTIGTPTAIVDTTPRSARIGWRANEDPNESFQGLIDELSVYDHALSSAEIKALFDAGNGPTP